MHMVEHDANRTYRIEGKMEQELSSKDRIVLITTDQKVPDLLQSLSVLPEAAVPQDLIVTQLTSGSKEYLDWVKSSLAETDIKDAENVQVDEKEIEDVDEEAELAD